MRMLKELYLSCKNTLRDGGIEAAEYEAQCLIEHITGYGRTALITRSDAPVSEEQKAKLISLTKKRLKHYPLQYLLGEWSFMGFPLSVGEGVLIPRDDTEVCTDLCLRYLKDKPNAKAVDLCAGSGAISIALAKLGRADVTAVELSEQAFEFLTKNIERNAAPIRTIRGDVFTCYRDFEDNSLDLIVSNPPYIKRSELKTLQSEVQFEPVMALDGGESGFDFYEAIIRDWSSKLKYGGALVFELGEEQAETVASLMKDRGFSGIRTEKDLGGCDRAIIGQFTVS